MKPPNRPPNKDELLFGLIESELSVASTLLERMSREDQIQQLGWLERNWAELGKRLGTELPDRGYFIIER